MRKIGLHLRLTSTIDEVAARAAALKIPIFQCFLIQQVSNQFISVPQEQIDHFITHWRPKFQELYIHGSYWINLASIASHNKIIKREIELAKKLEFTHLIAHPGSARRHGHKQTGITTIARNLNTLLKTENSIKVVLENTAHAGLSIGGDLHDFKALRERLDYPEKVLFCIDTAHAYSYGYDIATQSGQKEFLVLIEETIGFENIALIHLNDTKQHCGSRIDRHETIGNGFLGATLNHFIQYDGLKKVPIIMELPVISEDEEKATLKMVKAWDEKSK